MDRKFAVTVQHGGKHKSFYVSAGMTLGALKLLVKEERYFNIPYCVDDQKIYLKLKDKELRNNDATLAALGVYKRTHSINHPNDPNIRRWVLKCVDCDAEIVTKWGRSDSECLAEPQTDGWGKANSNTWSRSTRCPHHHALIAAPTTTSHHPPPPPPPPTPGRW